MKTLLLTFFAVAFAIIAIPASEPTVSSANPPPAFTTNAPVSYLTMTTNKEVFAGTRLIGRFDGTNYVAVPDLKAINDAHSNGFGLGVRYGAVATRRNPDLNDVNALVGIAQQLMQADQQKQQQTKNKRTE